MTSFKAKLADPTKRLSMHVNVIPSAVTTQAIAASGADVVVIDREHGAVDYGTCHAMIAATQGTECAPVVRVSEIADAEVKRVLDLGAEGIIFPLIRDAQDVRRAVGSMRYPGSMGTRGFGPFIAHSRWPADMMTYARTIEDRLTCGILIETVEAVANIDEIVAEEGIDYMILAAFDLSATMGIPGQFDHPHFQKACAKVEQAARGAGVPLGGIAMTEADAAERFAHGYRIISGFDILHLKAKVAQTAAWTRRPDSVHAYVAGATGAQHSLTVPH